MELKYRIVRARDYRQEARAASEAGARCSARRLATHEGETMLILPECALIGETRVAPNDPRIDAITGRWVRTNEPNAYVVERLESTYPSFGNGRVLLDRRPIGQGFAIRLPSGMCHRFATEREARYSQYWTGSRECTRERD